jgi:hypothetical protein
MHPKAYAAHAITVLECEENSFLVLHSDGFEGVNMIDD